MDTSERKVIRVNHPGFPIEPISIYEDEFDPSVHTRLDAPAAEPKAKSPKKVKGE